MSEQIKELIKQHSVNITIDGLGYGEGNIEKFAEMIMEEMYDFIMDESANDNGIPDLGKVKQHFGVDQ